MTSSGDLTPGSVACSAALVAGLAAFFLWRLWRVARSEKGRRPK